MAIDKNDLHQPESLSKRVERGGIWVFSLRTANRSLGFIADFIGLAIHALTANTFIILRIMEPFWFIAGMVIMLPTLKEEESLKTNDLL